jgi:hypothetical protein
MQEVACCLARGKCVGSGWHVFWVAFPIGKLGIEVFGKTPTFKLVTQMLMAVREVDADRQLDGAKKSADVSGDCLVALLCTSSAAPETIVGTFVARGCRGTFFVALVPMCRGLFRCLRDERG